MKNNLNIVYMGTPEFAVAPLACLLNNGYNIKAVITSPDKPAGRGLKQKESAVKKYALSQKLNILQPDNLKEPVFIENLKDINHDLQIIVAFRMLPEVIWRIPKFGAVNLHASILPQYRGAAPINWAIINGETKTGVTTFFINENIDTGNIIMNNEVDILPDETAGGLHDKLMNAGSELVLRTVQSIEKNDFKQIPQNILYNNVSLKVAPKIFKKDCLINWNDNADNVFNLIRGLSPYPTAYTVLNSPEGIKYYIKVFRCDKEHSKHKQQAGKLITDGKTHLSIAVIDGFIHLQEIQLAAKNKMRIIEFLRGFPLDDRWEFSCI